MPYQVVIKHDDQFYYLSPERSVKDKQVAYKPSLWTPDTEKNPMHIQVSSDVPCLY